ncbi:unc-51 like kinase 3 homolog Aduk [Aphomia sociella]
MMSFPKIEGYVVTEKLGSGSYSTVYKAYTKVGARSIVAVKCVDKSSVKHSGTAVENLITEIRLLKKLSHPHIVHMKEFTWDDKNIYIIMEYCCGGDLSKYIHRYGRVPEKQVLYFLQQLASALQFLREKGVVHMDLKPHNLLLHKDSDGKYILKVADFGFAQHMRQGQALGVRGSPLYMAPEVLQGRGDARADLWSVGVIMYECLFGRAPYSSSTFKELVDKIQKKAPIEIPRNSSITPGCQDLLTRLLQHDPDRRISYDEFFAHEYLDLENMPSKENYEKAVSLIREALRLEAAGALRPALRAYSGALRRLLPAARLERDALRRAALTTQLAGYMERAEQIKQYLKYTEGLSTSSDGTTRDDTSNDAANLYDIAQASTNCNCKSAECNGSVCTSCVCGTDEQTNKQSDSEVAPLEAEPSPSEKQLDNKLDNKRGARVSLRRLLGRAPSTTFLLPSGQNNSANSTQSQKETMPNGEANDGCRIT